MGTKKSTGSSPAELVRVGRDERERCVDELQEHYAAGRLGDSELAERVGAALTATTRSDLGVLLADLPGHPRLETAERGRGRVLIVVCGALIAGVLAVGAVGTLSTPSANPPDMVAQTICLSTGETGGDCPDVSSVQQQIFADADAADRAAGQLMEIADRHPEAKLTGLLERAWASSGRARDAAETSKQVVLAADGEPSEKVLAKVAETGSRAAEDTQKTLDEALERLGG